MRTAIALLFILGLALPVEAVTIRVPQDQPTIQAGIDAGVDDDTVLVAPGTYNENLSFLGKRIKLKSVYGANSATISAQDFAEATVSFVSAEPKGAEIVGFKIIGGGKGGIRCIGSSPTIRDNIIEGNQSIGNNEGAGIMMYDTFSSNVCQNTIRANDAGGPDLSGFGGAISVGDDAGSSQNDTIAYNLMYHNSGHGDIRVLGQIDGLVIINNTISAQDGMAIILQASGWGSIEVRNNIILLGSTYGIFSWEIGGTVLADYNCFFANGQNLLGISPGPGTIYLSPQFIDTLFGDYGLLSTSPCIDAGDPGSVYNDPDGTRNDIGAIYFDQIYPWAVNVEVGDTGNSNVIDQTPMISWSIFSPDSVPQNEYDIQIGTDDDWSEAELWQTGPITSSDSYCLYGGSELFDGATYFGRIRLLGGSQWGVWRGFQFRMNSIPSSAVLLLPIEYDVVANQHPSLVIRNSYDDESDSLFYDFEVSSDSLMSDVLTFSKREDSDSITALVVEPALTENARYWWRVKASDYYEESDYSETQSFWINSVNSSPTAFDLTGPPNTFSTPVASATPTLIWTPSSDIDPLDKVEYNLYIAIDSNFSFVDITSNIVSNSYEIVEPLNFGTRYWWKIKALDLNGGETWSSHVFRFRTMTSGDADGSGVVTVSDVVFLINYIFSGGPAPNPLSSGDADCSGAISISDAVYLIQYIFSGGAAPCEP